MEKFITLVAFDFSKSSSAVLEKAIDFTKKMSGELHVVNVIESSFFSKKMDLDSIKERGFLELIKSFGSIKKENYHCVSGKVKTQVANTAKILNADVIIMGNSGETHFLNELLMGSHTKEIVKNAQTPVLVMKSEHELDYKNILVLTDMSDESAAAIKKVTQFFPKSKTTLVNLFYLPVDNKLGLYGLNENDISEYNQRVKAESKENIESFLKSLALPSNISVATASIHSSLNPKLIKDELKNITYELLVIHAKESVNFFAFDVLEQSEVDVLVVK
ncbi:universal stress protein [Sulfurimonas sp.]|uniref:universal stress protein n=1 Tax=Sulfurimonas sp. TaxID=2022749 RepID=UPI0025DB291D|nr:universal stress protein [Sulfurimonas sp.]MBW6488015.1 universal stress protein [Sulfurimonas sp.]